MENFTFEETFCTLVSSIVFFLFALLSFACAVSAVVLGVAYRNDSVWKSTALIVTGIAILVGVAWGIETLNWSVPQEISLAAVLVVGPALVTLFVGLIFIILLDSLRIYKSKAGNRK